MIVHRRNQIYFKMPTNFGKVTLFEQLQNHVGFPGKLFFRYVNFFLSKARIEFSRPPFEGLSSEGNIPRFVTKTSYQSASTTRATAAAASTLIRKVVRINQLKI